MSSGFVRTFLLDDSSPVLQKAGKSSNNSIALLSDEVNRRIYIKQLGQRYLQQVQTRTEHGWNTLDIQLTKRQFSQLSPQVWEPTLIYSAKSIKIDGHACQIREFEGELSGLKILSVSFPDLQSAHCWKPRSDIEIGPEVTYNRNFADYSLITDPNGAKHAPSDPVHQKNSFVVGVIPYLPLSSGVELVIVHTRKKKLLIFPKGQPEPDLSADEVACLEAIEEAGIEGELTGHPILIPFKSHDQRHWLLYPMEVKTIQNEWKEKGLRDRSLIKLQEATGNPSYLRLAPALSFLTDFLQAKKQSSAFTSAE